jgi:hypothetical protein
LGFAPALTEPCIEFLWGIRKEKDQKKVILGILLGFQHRSHISACLPSDKASSESGLAFQLSWQYSLHKIISCFNFQSNWNQSRFFEF